jgi:hypothetical protein
MMASSQYEAPMSCVSMRIAAVFVLIAWLIATPPAEAESSARVTAVHPSSSAALGRNEQLWLRIEYETDDPIGLWARPYRNGVEVRQAMSNASLKYTGSGEALGWFSLVEPGDVDEVRIIAGGGKPYREWEIARRAVALHWTDRPATSDAPPAWVEELRAAEKVRYRQDAERRANEPTSATDTAIAGGFMLIVLALVITGIGVPIWTVWKWHGVWRIAAAVPAAVIGFVVLRLLFDTWRDPTSHNLWPFEVAMFGAGALVCIGVLALLRRFVHADP